MVLTLSPQFNKILLGDKMEEIWKDIPNYNGYQVSNLGRVRTYNKITYKQGIKRKWKDRILKYKCINKNAYKTGYKVDLWKDGKPKTLLVARLVAFTFNNEDITNHKLTVDHIDGNRFNNNLDNLELVSLAENIKRGFNTGLYKNQIKVKIINKQTNEENIFINLSKGSKFINHNSGYLSNKLKKKIFENKNFKWELLK